MAKQKDRLSFNFGANKVKKTSRTTKKPGGKRRGTGSRDNAWRAYVASNAPIPD